MGFCPRHFRYRKGLKWACENFKNLKRVRRAYACSAWLVQKVFYEQLEIKHREKMNAPWGKRIGIDEHTWRKRRGRKRQTEFASIIVDYDKNRIAELVNRKNCAEFKKPVGLHSRTRTGSRRCYRHV